MEENKETTDDGQPTTDNFSLSSQQPNNEASNENISSTTPIAETEQSLNLKPLNDLNDNMEVHHHSHAAHGKKTWKNYFWEFLMLFLAVFCGFIAENWREYYVERHKEKEYMQSMKNDLEKDVAQLTKAGEWLNSILASTDTTIILFNQEILNDSTIKEVYRHSELLFRIANTELDDRTASQLKNAGGMRLILNKMVLDSLSNYWYFQKSMYNVRDNLQLQKWKARDIELRILSQKYFSASNQPFERKVTGKPQFINGYEALLPEYVNRLALCREITKNYKRFIQKQYDLAISLINLINKEYHLE